MAFASSPSRLTTPLSSRPVLYLSASFSHARQPYLHEDLRVITIRGNLSSGNLHKTSVRLFKRVAMIVDFEDQKRRSMLGRRIYLETNVVKPWPLFPWAGSSPSTKN
jgi:hypothetical protein